MKCHVFLHPHIGIGARARRHESACRRATTAARGRCIMCGEAWMTSSADLGPPPEVWAFQERLLPVNEALKEVGAGDVAFFCVAIDAANRRLIVCRTDEASVVTQADFRAVVPLDARRLQSCRAESTSDQNSPCASAPTPRMAESSRHQPASLRSSKRHERCRLERWAVRGHIRRAWRIR